MSHTARRANDYKRPDTRELVVNGGPKFANTTGWTAAGNGSISVVSGNIRLSCTGASAYFSQAIQCEVGKQYLFSAVIAARALHNNSFLFAGTAAGNASMGTKTNGQNDDAASMGEKTLIFKATQAAVTITFSTSSASQTGDTIDVSSLSVKEY